MPLVTNSRHILRRPTLQLALVLIPLAASSLAHAGTIDLGDCLAVGGAYFACQSSLTTPANPTLGFGVTGSGFIPNPYLGGEARVDISGPGSGQFVGDVPVAWDFTLTDSGSASWSLEFDLVGSSTTYSFATQGDGSGNFSGSGVITGPTTPDALGSWEIFLLADGDENLALNVPAGQSLDLNVGTPTPEPATIGITASSLGALLLLLRRKTR